MIAVTEAEATALVENFIDYMTCGGLSSRQRGDATLQDMAKADCLREFMIDWLEARFTDASLYFMGGEQ